MHLLTTNLDTLLKPLEPGTYGRDCHLLDMIGELVADGRIHIRNEANLAVGDNVGGSNTARAAPGIAADDDGAGDDDPGPDRRNIRTCIRTTPPTGAPARQHVPILDALVNFDLLPNSAHVRLPVVRGLYACSPATVWRRVKAGTIPAPVKLSDRVTAWNVGALRSALADFRV